MAHGALSGTWAIGVTRPHYQFPINLILAEASRGEPRRAKASRGEAKAEPRRGQGKAEAEPRQSRGQAEAMPDLGLA